MCTGDRAIGFTNIWKWREREESRAAPGGRGTQVPWAEMRRLGGAGLDSGIKRFAYFSPVSLAPSGADGTHKPRSLDCWELGGDQPLGGRHGESFS